MEDLEIIIKIPERIKNRLYYGMTDSTDMQIIRKAFNNGIQLSKGHGRIIDEDEIKKCEQIGIIIKDKDTIPCFLTDAPTIVERDIK